MAVPPSALLLSGLLAPLPSTSARAADEPDEHVAGRTLIIRPGLYLKFVARPYATNVFDLPDATNAPTVEGAHLEVFDVQPPGAYQDFVLPAAGWTAIDTPAGGYRYRGAGSIGDPCRTVLVRPRVVKAVCRGTGVTLSTPFDDEVGVVLDVGTDTKRYCAMFGGTIIRNDPDALVRRDAPAPGVCPLHNPGSVTSTSTSTTSTIVIPEIACCASSLTAPSYCYYDYPAPCAMNGHFSGPFCDGAAGTCINSAPSPGNCCNLFPESCQGGPLVNEADCTTAGGTFGTGVCNHVDCEP